MNYFERYSLSVTQALGAAEVTQHGEPTVHVPIGEAFARLTTLSHKLKQAGATLFFCGNGASAAMASHMALDWLKAGRLKALSLSDSVALTAIANDSGYENAFSLQLSRLASADDCLVTISSSGNSPSVLSAIAEARRIDMTIVTFSGFSPNNASRQGGDLNFFVPSRTYGIAECSHQVLLHCWLDNYLGISEWTEKPLPE